MALPLPSQHFDLSIAKGSGGGFLERELDFQIVESRLDIYHRLSELEK